MCDTCKLDPAISKDKHISLVCKSKLDIYQSHNYSIDRKKILFRDGPLMIWGASGKEFVLSFFPANQLRSFFFQIVELSFFPRD